MADAHSTAEPHHTIISPSSAANVRACADRGCSSSSVTSADESQNLTRVAGRCLWPFAPVRALVEQRGQAVAVGVGRAGAQKEIVGQRRGGAAESPAPQEHLATPLLLFGLPDGHQAGNEAPAIGDEHFIAVANDVEERAQPSFELRDRNGGHLTNMVVFMLDGGASGRLTPAATCPARCRAGTRRSGEW